MAYKFETQYDSPNRWAGREGRQVERICIHWWDAPSARPSHDGVISRFLNRAAEVSAHFIASDGRVTCMVATGDTAWHCGNGEQNLRTIGIECSPYMTAGDFETVAELVADIWAAYGREIPLCQHRDIIPTQCAGVWGARLGELRDRARAHRAGTAQHTPAPAPAPAPLAPAFDVDAVARAVIRGEYGTGAERRARLGAHYEAVQRRVNEKLTGVASAPVVHAFDELEAARAVLRGEYGNGEERRRKLGAYYDAVQKIVNRRLRA